jgi:hypothetical protein
MRKCAGDRYVALLGTAGLYISLFSISRDAAHTTFNKGLYLGYHPEVPLLRKIEPNSSETPR